MSFADSVWEGQSTRAADPGLALRSNLHPFFPFPATILRIAQLIISYKATPVRRLGTGSDAALHAPHSAPHGAGDGTDMTRILFLHGLSGSPVWRIGVSGQSSGEWKPSDSLLVGILTQWRPDEKVLIATSTAKLPPSW